MWLRALTRLMYLCYRAVEMLLQFSANILSISRPFFGVWILSTGFQILCWWNLDYSLLCICCSYFFVSGNFSFSLVFGYGNVC